MKKNLCNSIKSIRKENTSSVNRRDFLKKLTTISAGTMVTPSLFNKYRNSADAQQKRYPDPAIEVIDKRFEKYFLTSAAVELLWTGARWAEGPVWFGDGKFLLFSDIPNDTIYRWTEETGEVSKFRHPSNNANGNTRDRQGRLITCEGDSRRVTRTEYDGSISILVDKYQGKKLNSPNDVIVHSNGSIWFTDPGYGILSDYEGHVDKFELPTNVYRLDPSAAEVSVVAGDFIRPNGLCFSPDEKLLYIVDTGQPADKPQPIMVFDVIDGKKLSKERLFVDVGKGGSDGIRCDADGNVWAASGGGEGSDGVHVFAPDGTLIGKICLPEVCANLCFGGQKHNRLFMTASQSLYSLYVNVKGAQKT
jgi:gluconolactonase